MSTLTHIITHYATCDMSLTVKLLAIKLKPKCQSKDFETIKI